MLKDPIAQFRGWFALAKRSKAILDATAMCLSTVGKDGFPEGRMVLLKEFNSDGFTFYTNLHSPKGRALRKIPRASLTFHWPSLGKQIRIQGKTRLVSDTEADAYWKTRPRLSRLGAWASKQSEVLRSRTILLKDVARFALKFGTGPIPRPSYWTGVRVVPHKIEFWQARVNRLHDRFLYIKTNTGWQIQRLYP